MPVSDHHPDEASGGELQTLLDEQRRLQQSIDRLIEEQRRHNGHGNGGSEGSEKKTSEENLGRGGSKDGRTQHAAGEEEEKEKTEEKEPKPPLTRRVANWVRTHPLGALLLLIFLAAAAVGGHRFWVYLQSYVSTDDAQIDGHIHQVSSRITGVVTGVYVENNRSVDLKQTLVDLDPRDYQTALSQAQANLAQAIASLNSTAPNVPITETTSSTNVATAQLEVANAEAALEAARHTYLSALADLEQARATSQNATIEERRYRRLVEKEEVSRELYDQRATQARAQKALVEARRASADAALQAVEQREAALGQARQRFQEAQSNEPHQVASQKSNVATRRANVEAARSQLVQAGLNLSYCKIVAPTEGIVGDKTVEVGQHVSPGQELLSITGTDDIWVTANFKETQIKSMSPGQSVDVYVDALAQKFRGWVQNMPGATGARYSLLPPENATGNYVKVVQRLPVRIRLHKGQKGFDRLRPGMSVEPTVWIK